MSAKEKNKVSKYVEKFQLNHKNTWLLWCCQLINIASLSAEVSLWMLAILGLCLSWQALLIKRTTSTKISPLLLKLFALSGCVAIAITAGSSGVLISMVHLLIFAYMLKSFEIKQRKDFYQLFLLGLFLLASAFIFKQNLVFSILIVFALIFNLVVLQQVFSPKRPLFASVKTIVMLLVQSSFLAIFLFIVFPRLSPFWQVPNNNSSQTGLSDELSPGDIANLALSSDLAFRVDFKGNNIPLYSDRYWRAMTLENYDGRKWTRTKISEKTSSNNDFLPITSGVGTTYEVIVEPSFKSWLFGLTVATSKNTNLRLLDDFTIQSRNVLTQISHYQLVSYLQAPLDLMISDNIKQRNLAIVEGSNPKLEALASDFIKKFPNPIDRSNAVLALFREQEYFYTLKPPMLVNNSLDQFFFDTKAGFCVHYASAYTYLMRAAGIPARVVTGYLGGEYNNSNSSQNALETGQDGHLSVYQYDAHAWAEIWLEGKGWFRVDPTAAVDPQRVNSGWSTALLTQQSLLNNDLLGLYKFKNVAWLNKLRLQFDALDYQWTRLVLGYSSQQQYDLLKRWFGDNIQWKVVTSIISILIGVMMLYALIYRFDFSIFRRNKITPWQKLYLKLLDKLAKKGVLKPIDLTPRNFAKAIVNQHPKLSKELIEFTEVFELLTYQKLSVLEQDKYLISLKNKYISIEKINI